MSENDRASTPVTDEDRNRFGALLDRAAERGLLSPTDYESRLRDLAAATTTEEMVAIVTDLPVLRTSPSAGGGSGRPAVSSARAAATEPGSRRWLTLAVLVAVVVVSLVVLGLVVSHLHRTSPSGGLGSRGGASYVAVSAPRP